MARESPPTELEFPGAESFLDVVTNIVGILVILTVIIGVRAGKAPVDVAGLAPEDSQLGELRATADTLERDSFELAARSQTLEQELSLRDQERGLVATQLRAAQRLLDEREKESRLSDRKRDDQERDLAELRAEIDRARRRRTELSRARPSSVKVASYPTPIAKTVDDHEIHFQIRGGRIVYVPFDELVAKLKRVAKDKASRLTDQTELTDTIGPVENFYLRYTLVRRDISFDTMGTSVRAGSVVELDHLEFVPFSSQLGETLDQALSNTSIFRGKLDGAKPGVWTVTLWAYPDSFDQFRRAREYLYQRGYTVAVRPLIEGINISASPKGSKSAAQ